MLIRFFSIVIIAVLPLLCGSVVDVAYSAPIEETLKTLRGLLPKERLTRVENEARKEGSVRWASSTPQAWAEPALQQFRMSDPYVLSRFRSQDDSFGRSNFRWCLDQHGEPR